MLLMFTKLSLLTCKTVKDYQLTFFSLALIATRDKLSVAHSSLYEKIEVVTVDNIALEKVLLFKSQTAGELLHLLLINHLLPCQLCCVHLPQLYERKRSSHTPCI